ncbi:hypothetical protein EYZ11_011287 [Aspergillus tanneri]|uniref:Uncharacterized protein n=1 Tax=Aspergillus tanneri TaxID=1220188 RepID=A0A4S3J5C4_9EURO|nr:hypothetical protein EYZ11_011287 [Aspergillus tanneri]
MAYQVVGVPGEGFNESGGSKKRGKRYDTKFVFVKQ